MLSLYTINSSLISFSCYSFAVRNYERSEQQSNWNIERLQIIHVKEIKRKLTEACLLNVEV